jgi:hypothetical protein
MHESKEKHIILVTNSPASDYPCHSCEVMDDVFEHVTRIRKAQIYLSLIAPKMHEGLQRLFEAVRL